MTPPRWRGRHYTPAGLAREIVGGALDSWFRSQDHAAAGRLPRVLDPACGDGALLVAALDVLAERAPAAGVGGGRHEFARQCLYGVDLDAPAVERLRARIVDSGDPDESQAAPEAWLFSHVVVGDALCGPGFDCESTPPRDASEVPHSPAPTGIDWLRTFPEVAAAGGFDVVVGNPPFVRERDARELFSELAETSLGRRWRTPRMDLWHYFVHRGLDLLKPGGVMSFVVPSYWTRSDGARRMIDRLAAETEFEDVLQLGSRRVFDGVQGSHLVFRLRKRQPAAAHQSSSERLAIPAQRSVAVRSLAKNADRGESLPASTVVEWTLSHDEMFCNGRLHLRPQPAGVPRGDVVLADGFEVRQGIAENPPRITARIAKQADGSLRSGEGVFVLSAGEVDALRLSAAETCLLRPYYTPAQIERYRSPGEPQSWLLYLTPRNAPDVDAIPAVARHLSRFRAVLEKRREVQRGRIGWWHLHWPREERLFVSPRILGVQMGRTTRFALAEAPTFVGFSLNIIVPRTNSGLSLAVLAGLLNSRTAMKWFEVHAKRRGTGLEIGGGLLRQFPLPTRNLEIERRLATHVESLCNDPNNQSAEEAVEDDVQRLYNGGRP